MKETTLVLAGRCPDLFQQWFDCDAQSAFWGRVIPRWLKWFTNIRISSPHQLTLTHSVQFMQHEHGLHQGYKHYSLIYVYGNWMTSRAISLHKTLNPMDRFASCWRLFEVLRRRTLLPSSRANNSKPTLIQALASQSFIIGRLKQYLLGSNFYPLEVNRIKEALFRCSVYSFQCTQPSYSFFRGLKKMWRQFRLLLWTKNRRYVLQTQYYPYRTIFLRRPSRLHAKKSLNSY